MKIYWGAGAAFAGYLALAWLTGSLLHLNSGRFYTLFAILSILGLGATAIFLLLWNRVRRGASQGAEGGAGTVGADQEIDELIHEADRRLAASDRTQGARLANLPVVFVIGEPGSTKTSTILHCGLDPELLAGSVYQDTTVLPTRLANVWFARGVVFVEAGGRLLSDPTRWQRFLERLRPARLRSVMGAPQAPRAALLCFDAESVARAGSGDALTVAARNLHARLGEISERFGISLPVYVLFTRMNRVAFFEDFARNLTAEEVLQPLGATLPLRPGNAGGVYAEEETARLGAVFDEIFHSLADHRLVLLSRENDPQKIPGAYEFPREFRKMRGAVVQFLVDVCRPSPLRAGAFLRGFYFSGVRPVVVHDVPAAAPRPSAAQRPSFEADAGATRLFSAATQPPAAPVALAEPPSGGHKAPQWLFLGHLFADVIARDETALAASGSSTKTSAWQRALLAAAAAALIVWAAGMTISFIGNRALVSEVSNAARAIPAVEAGGASLPSVESLEKLGKLRDSLITLRRYREQGAPLRLRWLLFSGDELYPQARRLYYAGFRQLLFTQTEANLLVALQRVSVPPAPTDEYGPTYDTLKAYLITTSEWKRSSPWLAPVLLSRWAAGRPVDTIRDQARSHFDFFAEDLTRGNPFSESNDAVTIDRARRHLSRFSGIEQIYQFMLSDVSRRFPRINFNQQFPGSAAVVVDAVDVPGAFTKAGWAAMQANLRRADSFFGGERWVLGDYAAAKPDAGKLEEELRGRYTADYIARWREFLRGASVVRYGSLPDASSKLNVLSSAQTPLLGLFWLATQNTAVDSPKVAEAFDSVQKVVPPPATTVQYVWPANQEYMSALASLQSTIRQAADSAPADPNRGVPVRQSADSARNIVKKMGYSFKIDPEAHLEATTLKLLEAPITYADALTQGLGAGQLNAKARQFCAAFSPTANKFPFNPAATLEATLGEIDGIFRPREGQLWTFYAEALQNLLPRQGAQYVANSSGGVTLTPGFVNFFNAAARFSEALYPGGAREMSLRYSLAPQPSEQIREMSAMIDGQTVKSSGGGAARQYVWPGTGAHEVRISARLAGGSDFEFQNRDGLWAVFRFFADADRWNPAGGGYQLEWVVRQGREGRPVMAGGKELTYRFLVDTGGAPLVFQKDFLNSLRCVSQAAR